MSENLMESMMQSDDGEFDISSIAMYKPFEGLLELRVVSAYTIHFFILQIF
jgi:aminotransferase